MKRITLLLSILMLAGCATLDVNDFTPQSDGAVIFDACKAADGLTTAVAVKSGKFVELNPLLKGIAGGGTSWYPFAGVITLMILAYNWLDNNGYIGTGPAIAANGVTCGVAGRNLWLLLK